jgi:FMN reductase
VTSDVAAPHIVGIGGTTRPGSSTERALRWALQAAERAGATTTAFAAEQLSALPMYAPEDPGRAPAAVDLIAELRRADGVVIASPGYHGAISGLVKNALDYVEDLSRDHRPYLDGLPVGCIATGHGPQATVATLQQLRTIAHALRGWPTPLGAAITTSGPVFGPDGAVEDERVAFQLETIGAAVVRFAAAMRGDQAGQWSP